MKTNKLYKLGKKQNKRQEKKEIVTANKRKVKSKKEMLFGKNKEMTFSPYNSVTKKQGSIHQSRRNSPQPEEIEEDQEQLNPDDLFMDYSYQQVNNIQGLNGGYSSQNNKMNNYLNQNEFNQGQPNWMNCQIVNLNQDNGEQNSLQNNSNSYMGQYNNNNKANQNNISPRLLFANTNEQDSNDNNMIGQSQSYIMNSSRFINNNISSILGNNCSQSNNYSNNNMYSLLQDNYQQNQDYVNVYSDQHSNQQEDPNNQNNYCVYQSNANMKNNGQNEYIKQSLRDQITQRLDIKSSNSNIQQSEQNNNFYKQQINQNIIPNIKDQSHQQQYQCNKQINHSNKQHPSTQIYQRSQSNYDIFSNQQNQQNPCSFNQMRRNSINDSSSLSSHKQNQSYQSLYTPRQVQRLSSNQHNFVVSNINSNLSNQSSSITQFANDKSDNSSSIQQNEQERNNQSAIHQKKQLLFSMIVETPDARQEVINVFENVSLQQLAEDFCVKNNMDIQKYQEFLTNRLQEALNHFNSFQSPKKKSKKQELNQPQQYKFVNNQESAIFQVTQKGIIEANNNKIVSLNQYTSNHPTNPNIISNNSQTFEQNPSQIDDSNRITQMNGSPKEQVFELPYKSLIYELDLSNLPDEICYNDYDELSNLKPLDSHSCQSLEQNNVHQQNKIGQQTQKDPNAASAITITLNPIENITQKINEQYDVNNIFEDQIQSQYQSIEQLKSNIQKSLAKQHNIQQEFHRRCNSYSQLYESNKNFNSVEKNNSQKNTHQEQQSPNIHAQTPNQVELSNHFNRYDILKYQESQESARQAKQSQVNQKYNTQEKYESNKRSEQINQSDKYSVKIISPLAEEKQNSVSDFMKKDDTNYLSVNQNQLRQAAQFSGKNNSFYSPSSTNSFEQNEYLVQQQKDDCAQFFSSNRNLNQNNQNDFLSQRSDLKNQLLQAQHKFCNQDIKLQRQNMSSLASQIDDYKNGETLSLKSEIGKNYNYNNNDSYKQQQQQQINPLQFNCQEQHTIFDGITNYSSIQKEKQISDSESMRMFDEKQQEMIPGCYKICQSRIEFEEINRENGNQQKQNPNDLHIRSFYNNQNDISCNAINNSNSYQNQIHLNPSNAIQQKVNVNKLQSFPYSQNNNNIQNYQSNDYYQFQSNCNSSENELKEIPNSSIQSSQNKESFPTVITTQYNSISKEDKQLEQQSQQSQSSHVKPSKYQLPPTSSNSKGNSYSNGGMSGRSTNRNTSCYSSVNQNLSSVKRNLFSMNNSQRSLNSSSINQSQQQLHQNQQQSHQYQNENQSHQQSNISTARQSVCSQSKGYDSIPMSNRTPNSKQPLQSARPQIEKSENFDQLKQNIFNSIMKSNPSQIMNDVKHVKLNLSPFFEQNKINQQIQGPLNELYNQHMVKQQLHGQSNSKMKVPTISSQYNQINCALKTRNNSISNLRSSKNFHNQNQNEINKNVNKNDKRSSSITIGRHQACKANSKVGNDNNIQKKGRETSNSSFKFIGASGPISSYNLSETVQSNCKMSFNQSFKQRINEIFTVLDSDCDGYISADKIEIRNINDLVLFIITPVLIEIFNMKRSVNIEEFSCAFLKLFFNLPKQQQEIIINKNVEICWIEEQQSSQSFQNLEFFNFNSPLYQQYIDKKNTMQLASNKTYNWMLDLTNREFLEFYMSNFKTLVKETNKYIS